MTTDNIYIANAAAVAQITTVTIVDANPDSPYAISVAGKLIQVDGSSSVSDIASRLADAWNDSDFPETDAATATASGATVTLTADEPGVPFRVAATRTPTIKVVTTQAGVAPVNQITRIALPETTTGGTFTITVTRPNGNSDTTVAIAYNASAATIKTEIVDLSAQIDTDDVNVTGEAGGPWDVEWIGSYAGQAVGMSVNANALTGNATVEFTKIRAANANVRSIQIIGQQSVNDSSIPSIRYVDPNNVSSDYYSTSDFFSINSASSLGGHATDAAGEEVACFMSQSASQYGQNGAPRFRFGAFVFADSGDKGQFYMLGGGLSGWSYEIQEGDGGSNNQVYLVESDGDTAYTLTINGETTASIDPTALSESALESAIAALASVSASDFEVSYFSDGSQHGYAIIFVGSLAGSHVTLTVSAGTVQECNRGSAPVDEIHAIYVNAASGTFTLDVRGVTSGSFTYGGTNAAFQSVFDAMVAASFDTLTVDGPEDDRTYFLEYGGNDGGQEWDLPTLNTNSLLGGELATLTTIEAAVAGVDEIQTITVDSFATGGTFPLQFNGEVTAGLDYDATATEVQTALRNLDGIGATDVAVTGEDGGPYTVTFQSGLAETNVPQIVGISDSLTISLDSIEVATLTRSGGPLHADDPLNWSLGHVLRTDERPVFERGRSGPTFGLKLRDTFTVIVDDPDTAATETATTRLRLDAGFTDLRVGQTVRLTTTNALPTGLAAATLYYVVAVDVDRGFVALSTTENGATVSITSAGTGTHTIAVEADGLLQYARHTGEIGLAARNENGYEEYLTKHFTIGIASGGVIVIGEGQGEGSGLIRLDTGGYAVAVQALNTAGSAEQDANALEWITTANGSTLLNLAASTGVSPRVDQVGAMGNLTQRDGEIDVGPNVVFATGAVLDITGGDFRADGATLDGVIRLRG